MTQKFIILMAFLTILTSHYAHAEDSNQVPGILAAAKFTGACGIMDSLIHFQKTTKMDGGDEFVTRFWQLEATRLGLSVQEYSDQCDKSTALYNVLQEEASKPK